MEIQTAIGLTLLVCALATLPAMIIAKAFVRVIEILSGY